MVSSQGFLRGIFLCLSPLSYDEIVAQKLWESSEGITKANIRTDVTQKKQ